MDFNQKTCITIKSLKHMTTQIFFPNRSKPTSHIVKNKYKFRPQLSIRAMKISIISFFKI